MLIRTRRLPVFAVMAALSALPSVAGASTLPGSPNSTLPGWTPAAVAVPTGAPDGGNVGGATGPCGTGVSGGQGPAGSTASQVCQGAGLSFIGPAIGQIASVIGPTIISPAVVGNQILTSAGSIANGN